MSELSGKTCEACRVDAPLATDNEIKKYLEQIPDWEIVNLEGMKRLSRSYKFNNFVDALEFTNKLGALAEEEGHHPAILTEWGKVSVLWWTHKINGLHVNDFIMAAKTDQLV